jgi:hypothetical protein
MEVLSRCEGSGIGKDILPGDPLYEKCGAMFRALDARRATEKERRSSGKVRETKVEYTTLSYAQRSGIGIVKPKPFVPAERKVVDEVVRIRPFVKESGADCDGWDDDKVNDEPPQFNPTEDELRECMIDVEHEDCGVAFGPHRNQDDECGDMYPIVVKIDAPSGKQEIAMFACNAVSVMVVLEDKGMLLDEDAYLERNGKPIVGMFSKYGFYKHSVNYVNLKSDFLVGGMPGKWQVAGRGRRRNGAGKRKKKFAGRGGRTGVQGRRNNFNDQNRPLSLREFNMRPGKITRITLGPTLPDEFKQDILYSEAMRTVFIVAETNNTLFYNMNAAGTLQTGGSPAIIAGWQTAGGAPQGMLSNYRRYRVLKSYISIKVRNREATNPIDVILYPTQVNTAITTPAEFSYKASQPYVIRRQLGPVGASDAKAVLSMKFSPSKFYPAEYHTQDEYSGSVSTGGIVNPSTLIYWAIAFYNPSLNTVTTGGLKIWTNIAQRVLVYEIDRDEDPATMRVVDGVLTGKAPLDTSLEEEIDDVVAKVNSLKVRTAKQ